MIGFFFNTNCTFDGGVIDLVEFIDGGFIREFWME